MEKPYLLSPSWARCDLQPVCGLTNEECLVHMKAGGRRSQQRSQGSTDDLQVLGENQKPLIGTMPCAISVTLWKGSVCMSLLCPLPFFLTLPSSLLPSSSSFPFLSVHPFPVSFSFPYKGAQTSQPVFLSIRALIYTTSKFCTAVTSLRYLCPGST